LATELNVFEHFRPQLPARLSKERYVFLANIDPELQLSVLEQIDHPKYIACDTIIMDQEQAGGPAQVIERVDFSVLNDRRPGSSAIRPAWSGRGRILQSWGPKCVLIKKGEHGA